MTAPDDDAVERAAARVRALLGQPFAFVEGGEGRYRLRLDDDRRRRPALTFDEAVFARLAGVGVLTPRQAGGWRLARTHLDAHTPPQGDRTEGRPGVVEGERMVAEPDGRLVRRRVNLNASPVAWLAARRDAAGRPFVERAEAAAAERLADDHARTGVNGRLTMDWSPTSRSGGAGWNGLDSAERARFAKVRLLRALEAMDRTARPVVEQICLRGCGLEQAERLLGLRPRTGRAHLTRGLRQLAEHYGLS